MKKLYINGKFIGLYTLSGDCSIGYSTYRYFGMGNPVCYETIVRVSDIDTAIEDDNGCAIFTKVYV